jgi:ribonuclease E
MSKEMIVNATHTEELRVAIIEDSRLVELDFESGARAKNKGNIFKGIVSNIEDGLEAAFIEFGEDKHGFLSLSELRKSLYPDSVRGKKNPRISEILKVGQEIVVQVTKDEIGTKGAAVTTYLSLPGRYVVLMHSEEGGGGISKKIQDENARRRARDMLSRIEVPDGMAVIIRTAGMHRPLPDLFRDLLLLCKVWERIDKGAQLGRAPTILYREPDLVARTVRDYVRADISKIIIDSEEEYQEAKSYFEEWMPDVAPSLEFYNKKRPIFDTYGIEKEIDALFQRETHLPSGGSIVIDSTEALVAIDVNSGKSNKEGDHEATVFKTNMEAAVEIARQLRLRDLGGIIVIDFIDMVSRRHERDVEYALREALRVDRARIKLGQIGENGTLELTRQRLKQAHRLVSFVKCEHCSGTGIVRDPEGLAVTALREIQRALLRGKKKFSKVSVVVPAEVSNALNNAKRKELYELSQEYEAEIEVIADAKLSGSAFELHEERRGQAGIEAAKTAEMSRSRNRGGEVRPLHDQPPPTIGPRPQFFDDESVLLDPDKLAEVFSKLRDKRIQPVAKDDDTGEHYEHPLEEALFGTVLKGNLDEFEIEADQRVEPIQNGQKTARLETKEPKEKTGSTDGQPRSRSRNSRRSSRTRHNSTKEGQAQKDQAQKDQGEQRSESIPEASLPATVQ